MSATKNAYETLRTWELLDWYADEAHGNWEAEEIIKKAFIVRDYYQTEAQKDLGIEEKQFAKFVDWHYSNINQMSEEEEEQHYHENWAEEAKVFYNYYAQICKRKGLI
jgi:RNA polymerase-interacting CarD/CdnL/TRCF family regulator